MLKPPTVPRACWTWHLFREGPIRQGAVKGQAQATHHPEGAKAALIQEPPGRAGVMDGRHPATLGPCLRDAQTAVNPPGPSLTLATRRPSPGLGGLAVPLAALSLSARGSHPATGVTDEHRAPRDTWGQDRPAAQPGPLGSAAPHSPAVPLSLWTWNPGPSWGSRSLSRDSAVVCSTQVLWCQGLRRAWGQVPL